MNLLINAAHAIEGQGVITIRTLHRDDAIVVEIADTGKGIEPDHLLRIFNPSFTTKGSGIGMGARLVYRPSDCRTTQGQAGRR